MYFFAEAALKESATVEDDEPIEVEDDSDDDGSSVDTDDIYDDAWDQDETMDKAKLTVLVRKAKRTEQSGGDVRMKPLRLLAHQTTFAPPLWSSWATLILARPRCVRPPSNHLCVKFLIDCAAARQNSQNQRSRR